MDRSSENGGHSNNSEVPSGYIPVNRSPFPSSNHRGQDRSFSGRMSYQNQRSNRNSGFGHGFSPYNQGQRNYNKGQKFDSKPKDISSYYHKSMIQDPWARLEKRLLQKQNEQSDTSTKSDTVMQTLVDPNV